MIRLLRTTGLITAVCFTTAATLAAVTKHETDVFGKWLAWQQIYNDRNIADVANNLDDTFLNNFRDHYQKNIPLLKNLTPLLATITNNLVQEDGYLLAPPLTQEMHENLRYLYEQIENNMPAFVDSLLASGLADKKNAASEQEAHYDATIEKYKAFSRMLFAQPDAFKENEYLFAFGNRLFEYCFSEKTFPHYQRILTTEKYYPVARFLNAIIWYQLVGDGWKHWHADALRSLKEKAAQGNEIVYLAGGTDVYHLLRNGIYDITVIDPFLPTQARYYSEGWDYLTSEQALGDEIRFGPACNSIKMKCVEFQATDPFYSKLSNGNILTLKKSVVTWHVFDRDNHQIGHVIFHRRPVAQEDFAYNPTKTFVMSYDELTFIAVPDMLNGWNIDPTKLDGTTEIFVKQNRRPVDKNMLCNIRIASMLNMSDLRFINLGSDPT